MSDFKAKMRLIAIPGVCPSVRPCLRWRLTLSGHGFVPAGQNINNDNNSVSLHDSFIDDDRPDEVCSLLL